MLGQSRVGLLRGEEARGEVPAAPDAEGAVGVDEARHGARAVVLQPLHVGRDARGVHRRLQRGAQHGLVLRDALLLAERPARGACLDPRQHPADDGGGAAGRIDALAVVEKVPCPPAVMV